MTRWLTELDRGFFDLAFPRDCAVTQEPMDEDARLHLSAAGADQLTRIHDPRCLTCGHPFEGILEGDRACPHCLDLRPAFGRAVCAFRARGLFMLARRDTYPRPEPPPPSTGNEV